MTGEELPLFFSKATPLVNAPRVPVGELFVQRFQHSISLQSSATNPFKLESTGIWTVPKRYRREPGQV